MPRHISSNIGHCDVPVVIILTVQLRQFLSRVLCVKYKKILNLLERADERTVMKLNSVTTGFTQEFNDHTWFGEMVFLSQQLE